MHLMRYIPCGSWSHAALSYCWSIEMTSMNTPNDQFADVPRCGDMEESQSMCSVHLTPLISSEKKNCGVPAFFSNQTKRAIHKGEGICLNRSNK